MTMADESYTYLAPLFGVPSNTLRRESDRAFIPCNLDNMDYLAFLDWLAEGNPGPEGWTGPTNDAPT